MLHRIKDILSQKRHAGSLKRWDDAATHAKTIDVSLLRQMRTQARQLRSRIDRVTHIADGRLTLPRIGSNAMRKSSQSDWAYRPEIWRGPVSPVGISAIESRTKFGSEAAIYHDCPVSEITMRQVRNTRETDLAPFALRFDVFNFDGSFLSLVQDLPEDAATGLRKNHILHLDAVIEAERPLEVFARLNIKHGPNVEQMVRELRTDAEEAAADYDLGTVELTEKRIERLWLDLIFEGPQMNEIILRDLTISRRPRADF